MTDEPEVNNTNTEENNTTSEDTEATKHPDIPDQIMETVKGVKNTLFGIGEALGATMKTVLTDRDFVVMVRVNKETRDHLDNLMQAGLFKSRSEAAAFLLASGIEAQAKLFDKIKDKTTQINQLQDELRTLITGTTE